MEEKRTSILPDAMRGVMTISGYRGIGKTFLASQADLPQNIAFFDFEEKGKGIDESLGFGLYDPLTQRANGNPKALYDSYIQKVNAIEPGRFTVAILDNISPLELAMKAEARRDAKRYCEDYGLNLKNILAGRFGGLNSVVNFLISDKISAKLHHKGVKLIIATSHIKPSWGAGGPIPNKYRVKGADRWQELSILSLVLIPGSNPPIPSALVMKEQLGTIALPENVDDPEVLEAMRRGEIGHELKRRLPVKIPECTFAAIRHYLYNPADLRNPAAGEVPTEEEVDPFRARLSKEQMAYARLQAEAKRAEESEEEEVEEVFGDELNSPAGPAIRPELLAEISNPELPAPVIYNELNERGITATIPEIIAATNALKAAQK